MTVSFPHFQFGYLLFRCLITVARTSNTVLNRCAERGHPCLVPDLSGKVFSFHPLSMMWAVGLSYMAFIMLRNDPSISTLLSVFIINGCCILSNAFSPCIDMIMWFLSLVLFMWPVRFFDLQILCHLASLGSIPPGHGVRSFQRIAGCGLAIFCGGF